MAPSFTARAPQVMALALLTKAQILSLTNSSHRLIMLDVFAPFPEESNTYSLRTDKDTGNVVELCARAPNYMFDGKKMMPIPEPYTNGFLYWSIEYNHRTNDIEKVDAFVYTLYNPRDEAINRSKTTHSEILETNQVIRGRMNYNPYDKKDISMLPPIKEKPFYASDFRRIRVQDIDRAKKEIRGFVVQRLDNYEWKFDDSRAFKTVMKLQRALDRENRFAHNRYLQCAIIFVLLCAILVPVLLLSRRKC